MVQQAVQQVEAQLDEQRALYLARLKLAGLRGRLQDATFTTFSQRHDWPDAEAIRARVWAYTEKLLGGELERQHSPRPIPALAGSEAETAAAMLGWLNNNRPVKNWLILYGDYGTGKSHLAAAIIREAIDRGFTNCYFRGWVHYLQRLQWSWSRDEGDREAEKEADIVRELQQGQIVVIDDLDKRTPSEWVRSSLYSVLHYRYEADLPTILTFNYGPDDADPKARGRLALEAYLGRAVLDRLIESAYDVIEFAGPSYRSGVTLEAK